MFLEQLEQAEESSHMISIYSDKKNTDSFSVGFISACNEEDYILKSISPRGGYDGYCLRKTGYIFKIEFDGPYERKIQTLVMHKRVRHEEFDFGYEDLIKSILEFALQKQYAVAIELLDSGYFDCIGFITSIEDEYCMIFKLDKYGGQNGAAVIELSDITKINVDTEDEQDLKILYIDNN